MSVNNKELDLTNAPIQTSIRHLDMQYQLVLLNKIAAW